MPRIDPRLATPANSVNEVIQDATVRHMLFLEGLKTRQAREILAFIDDEVIPDLKEQLEIRLARGMRQNMTATRLEAMIRQFEDLTDNFKNINTRIQGELFDVALHEAEFNLDLLKQSTPVNVNYVAASAETIRSAVVTRPFDGRTLGQWFDTIGDSAQSKIAAEVRRGVTEGQTAPQIARRIFDSNILDVSRRNVETVVRTAVQHVTSAARDEVFKANADIIKAVKWISTLDTRTSAICQSLDSKTFPVDSGPRPPIHPNCRSAVVPVTKSFRELGLDVDDADAGTRASMNGQVPSDITYDGWLRGQPVSVQNDALGVTRATLFRKGDLPVDRFVNRSGFELTLDQLRARDADAFRRAGL